MTDEARPWGRSNLWFVIVVALLLSALATEGFVLLRSRSVRPRAAGEAIKAARAAKVETFGDPAAPIKIELYAPLVLEWHQKTIGLLRQYDNDHPGRIHVKLMPMGNAECDKDMEKRGYTCAVLFINGETEFQLPNGKQVSLEKKPNFADSFYNSEDVITILDQLAASERE